MNSSNPAPSPAILITDNPRIAEIFNDQKYAEPGPVPVPASLNHIVKHIKESFPGATLFLNTQNTGFISLDLDCMLNTAPRASIKLYETSEFFELKLLRSATANLMAQRNGDALNGVISGPTRTFYMAFGVGDNLDYWSPFSAYRMIGAQTFEDFDEVRTIKLDFVAGFGLGDFSKDSLKAFVNPDLMDSGHIAVFDKFKKAGSDGKDDSPVKNNANENNFILARREYRSKNLPFYIASIDNVIDKTLQTIFDTDNVLILNYKPPYPEIEKIIGKQNNVPNLDLSTEYDNLVELKFAPSAKTQQLFKLRAFSKVIQEISTYFGVNAVPRDTPPEGQVTTIQEKVNKDDQQYAIENIKTLGYSLNTDKVTGKDKDIINAILEKFRNGYNQLLATESYCYFREADLSVLKQVDLAIEKDFGKSFFNRDRPLIVFGPKELVANYFYGFKYTVDLASDFAKTPDNVEKTIQRRLNTVYNLYGSQQINDTTLAKLIEDNENIKNKINNLISNNNYPVFKYNMQNSNVISMKISDNNAYYLLLNQGYSVLDRYASIKTTTLRDPTEDIKRSEEEFLSYIYTTSDFDEEGRKRIRNQEIGGLGPLTPEQAKKASAEGARLRDNQYALITDVLREKRKKLLAHKLAKASDVERLKIIEGSRDVDGLHEILGSLFSGKDIPTVGDYVNEFDDEDEQSAGWSRWLRETAEQTELADAFFDDSVSNETRLEILRSDKGFNEEYLQQEAKLYLESVSQKYGLISVVEDAYASDPLKFFVDQINAIDKVTFQVEIETLPFFQISNYAFFLTPCILFAQRPSFIGDTKTRNPLDSISGAYNILGYSHTINTTKVTSSFKLFSLERVTED